MKQNIRKKVKEIVHNSCCAKFGMVSCSDCDEATDAILKLFNGRKGERAYNWKGHDAGYSVKHGWLVKYFGHATKCVNPQCVYPRKNKRGKMMEAPKRYEWANISGEYKRDISDYMQLCPSCHRMMDYKTKLERLK